jgi:preprotein translocase subunit SecA
MMAATSSNVATKLFKVKVEKETEIERIEREDAARHQQQERALQMRHGSEVDGNDTEPEQAPQQQSRRPQPRSLPPQPPARPEGPKIGRNDPCPCGSGQKFKKCHGAALEEEGASDADDASP